jgi:hypothetical protein
MLLAVTSICLFACASTSVSQTAVNSTPVVFEATSVPLVEATATELSINISSTAYRPLSLQDCQAIHDEAAKALQSSFSLTEAPFTNPFSNEKGTACTLEATGTGVNFDALGVAEVTHRIGASLSGWTYQSDDQANGQTGDLRAYTRGSELVVVSANWKPSADTDCSSGQQNAICPKDQPNAICSNAQPIASCALEPDEKLYTIVIQAAQK